MSETNKEMNQEKVQEQIEEQIKANQVEKDARDKADKNVEEPVITEEERQQIIKQFNESPENIGYIQIVEGEPNKDDIEIYKAKLEEINEIYKDNTVIISKSGKDAREMVNILIELVKDNYIWEGGEWKTILTLVSRLEEARDEIKKNKGALVIDLPTVYVLNKILSVNAPKGGYRTALFFNQHIEKFMYYGNRISVAYEYFGKFAKEAEILQKAINVLTMDMNVEVTIPERPKEDYVNIEDIDAKTDIFVQKQKEFGILKNNGTKTDVKEDTPKEEVKED